MKDDDDNVTSISDFLRNSDKGEHKNWEFQRLINLLKEKNSEKDDFSAEEQLYSDLLLNFLKNVADRATKLDMSVGELMEEMHKMGLLPLVSEEDEDEE